MLGLFGTLNLATRSLATQQLGTEVAGHNLANVNNPAYARQRVSLSTSVTVPTHLGPQGTGSEAVAIAQLRSALLDRHIAAEGSVLGSLTAQQRFLEYAQTNLGQMIDRQATGAEGTASTGGVGGQHGIAEQLSSLFSAFQSLSTNPTSTAERQVLLLKAQNVSTQFNQTDRRMGELGDLLNDAVRSDVASTNGLLADIAKLNEQISSVEINGIVANDLRDIRQQRVEELSKLVPASTSELPGGMLDVTIGGVTVVHAREVVEQLETYDAGGGQLLVRAQGSGAPVTLSGGSIHGAIEIRDGALAQLRTDLDTLAGQLIAEVNALHSGGFSLTGSTGRAFFTGTRAADIGVDADLLQNPALIQAAGVPDAPGDNQVVLGLARLAEKKIPGLGNQTFAQGFGQTVARLGQSLASVNSQIDNQKIVTEMLNRQRDAISGVSLDEEMTDLIRFQKAFQASARLVNAVDEMLDIIINLKR